MEITWKGERVIVEAYTASWIEMLYMFGSLVGSMSRLIQPRGLKYGLPRRWTAPLSSRLIQPRGLKLLWIPISAAGIMSRLIQPRGLK